MMKRTNRIIKSERHRLNKQRPKLKRKRKQEKKKEYEENQKSKRNREVEKVKEEKERERNKVKDRTGKTKRIKEREKENISRIFFVSGHQIANDWNNGACVSMLHSCNFYFNKSFSINPLWQKKIKQPV